MQLKIGGTQMSHNQTWSEEERKRNENRGMGTPRSWRTPQGQAIEGFFSKRLTSSDSCFHSLCTVDRLMGVGNEEHGWSRSTTWEDCNNPGKRCWWFLSGSSRDLKWTTSGNISEIDPADFADGLNIGCERNRVTELILSFCPKQLEKWSYIEVRKPVGEAYWKKEDQGLKSWVSGLPIGPLYGGLPYDLPKSLVVDLRV